MELLIGFVAGAICATAVPFVYEWAVKARDWLRAKIKQFRRVDDNVGG